MEKKSGKEVVKSVLKFVEGIGAGLIVANAVSATSPVGGLGVLARGCVKVTQVFIGGMLGDATGNYSDKLVDDLCDTVKIEITEKEDEDVVEAEVVS